MVITDQLLVLLAIIFFLIAAFPPQWPALRFEMLAFACLAATLL